VVGLARQGTESNEDGYQMKRICYKCHTELAPVEDRSWQFICPRCHRGFRHNPDGSYTVLFADEVWGNTLPRDAIEIKETEDK